MHEHYGHRKRIIEKLEGNFLLDHELLEILLFNAVPRRNTNDLAHRLLARFGSIPNVFSASFQELCEVDGVGESVAAYLCSLGKINKKFGEQKRKEFQSRYDMQKFCAYIMDKYGREETEVIDAYALDKTGKIFETRRFTCESLARVDVEPAELSQFLLAFRPAGLIMVHNHPTGEARASKQDDMMTRKAQMICSMQNILFCDHLIYGVNGIYSYYLDGKLVEISKRYSVQELAVKE